MKKSRKIIWVIGFVVSIVSGICWAEEDTKGCKDHPLFTRMSNFYITYCRESKFDQIDFRDEKGNPVEVEGRYFYNEYSLKKGSVASSSLEIIRNFESALKKIGGIKLYEKAPEEVWLKLEKEGKTFYAHVRAPHGETYYVTIVEKQEMPQQVVADAKSMLSDIEKKGSASVYGIYFDFGKADVKPESEPAIREIAKLLKENKTLKLYVVGHTDNVGSLDYNLKLSKARADAVVKELVTKHGIGADRLKAYGVGSLAPVASNRTEEGRAKNRRVEVVEQ